MHYACCCVEAHVVAWQLFSNETLAGQVLHFVTSSDKLDMMSKVCVCVFSKSPASSESESSQKKSFFYCFAMIVLHSCEGKCCSKPLLQTGPNPQLRTKSIQLLLYVGAWTKAWVHDQYRHQAHALVLANSHTQNAMSPFDMPMSDADNCFPALQVSYDWM